ncbi:MAG: Prolipoprotein diacylglyceryl transferase [Candidatus Omnitrophica bacterium]|nr:Prolipoprotein diacylglyceryl transferase [Candidatus Omnitrophota bacterium]
MYPVLFTAGGLTFYTYGLFVALAVAASFVYASVLARRAGLAAQDAADLVFLFFVTGVIGARLFYVVQNGADYVDEPLRAFRLQEGGLVYYGGFLTAAAAGALYGRLRGWPVLRWADVFAPVLALAHAIGRVGCFLNGCCYGRPAPDGWGVVYPGDDVTRVPVQLFESAALVVLSVYLVSRLRRDHGRDGRVFAGYLFFYALVRFSVEFMRGDQVTAGFLSVPQWTSLVLAAAGGYFLYRSGRRPGGMA